MKIDKAIWKLQKVSDKQGIGSASRRNSRAKERLDAQHKLLNILGKRHPNWLAGANIVITLSQCEALLNELEQVKSDDAQYKFMHNFLCESLARGNKIPAWDAQIPPPVQTFINERAHRAETDFHLIANFRKVQQQFLDEIQKGRLAKINQDPDEENAAKAIIRLITEYAVLFGGLVVLEELQCLVETACDIRLFSDGKNCWIDLYVKKSGGSITANPVSSESKLRRWYIDIPLIALLRQFQSKVHSKGFSAELTVKSVLKQRFQISNSKSSRISSVTALLKTAALVWELDNPSKPGFLSSVVKGNLRSHSLPAHVLEKLYQSKLLKPIQKNNSEKTAKPKITKDKISRYRLEFSGDELFDYHTDRKLLTRLSRVFDFKERKKSHALLIKELNDFLDNIGYPSPLLALLVKWAEHLLQHGTRFKKHLASNSVRNYISRVGNCWLKYAEPDLKLEIDELEWEHFYHQILTSQKGQKGLANLMGRLAEFHHYLAETWGVVSLPESIFRVNPKNFAVVRSNYINETEFSSLCLKLKSDYGNVESRKLLSIAILAYRCGMRKGEIIKLKVSDIDFHDERLIRIRSNQFGSNKSESAYRIIPLHLLAPQQEQQIVGEYVALCEELNQNTNNKLLFYLPMTSGSKLTSDYIDENITSLLKLICRDQSVNFHTLRHAFINNLYIRLFIKEQDWMFAPANYPRLDVGLSDLAGDAASESGKALFAIATVAGHASPEETLLSYCHFLDVHQHHCSNPMPIENIEILSPLLNMRPDTYVRFYQRNKQNLTAALSRKLIREWTTNFAKEEQKLTLIKPDSKPSKSETAPDEHPAIKEVDGNNIDATAVMLILNAYDKGKSVTEIAKVTGYHDTQVTKVVNAATELADIKTAKGQSRLISRTRISKATDQNGNPRRPIAPLLPREAKVKNDALKMVEKGIKILGSGKSQCQFKEALDYYVNNVVTTKPGIALDSPKSALLMINLFKELASFSRLYVYFQPATSEQFHATNNLLVEKGISFSDEFLFIDKIKPYLCVNHPSAGEGEFKSAASLHYAVHLLSMRLKINLTGD